MPSSNQLRSTLKVGQSIQSHTPSADGRIRPLRRLVRAAVDSGNGADADGRVAVGGDQVLRCISTAAEVMCLSSLQLYE